MAVFCTVLPTWMIAESIRRIGASTASLIGSLGPLFTIGFGALLLDEPVNVLQLIGVALVLAGVVLVSRHAGRPASRTPVAETTGIPSASISPRSPFDAKSRRRDC